MLQQGLGYGSDTVRITAKIDGTVVFEGDIPTLNEPVPPLPSGLTEDANLFTWTNDVTFAGTSALEITVTGGTLVLTDTLSNYIGVPNNDNPPPDVEPGGPDVYGIFWYESMDGGQYGTFDPLADVAIDGVPKESFHTPALTGQWYWAVPAGSTITATVNISAGVTEPY